MRRLRGDLTLKTAYANSPEHRLSPKPWCYPLMIIDWLREEIQREIKHLLALLNTEEGRNTSDLELREKFFDAVQHLIEYAYDKVEEELECDDVAHEVIEDVEAAAKDEQANMTADMHGDQDEFNFGSSEEDDTEIESSVSGSCSIEIKTKPSKGQNGLSTAAEEKRRMHQAMEELARGFGESSI